VALQVFHLVVLISFIYIYIISHNTKNVNPFFEKNKKIFFKKRLDKSGKVWYNIYSKRKAVSVMNNQEIALCWERAKRMAERIWEAYIFGTNKEQAKADQKSLALWLDMVKEYGLIYNGSLDEYVTLKL
jgi:hypothetical protein